MANYLDDNEDLRFYLNHWLDWETLFRVTEFAPDSPDAPASLDEAKELYKDILSAIAEFAAEGVAPRAASIDTDKPKLVDGEVVPSQATQEIFENLKDMEVYGMCLPREFGGMNLPFLTYMMSIELIARADVSTVAHYGFHGGIAMAMLMYSIREGTTTYDTVQQTFTGTRFAEELEAIRSGLDWGSMDLTEADAGSDLGALRSRAVLGDDGIWRITGSKVFITSGHGRFHFVIARTEDSKGGFGGLDGLSLFLVPAWDRDEDGQALPRKAFLDALENKLGHTGSATVTIRFEDTPGVLVGNRGEGFKQMLLLMNNARVGVGFESLGLCEAAYRLAADYAAQRPSMGKMIARHEMIADLLEEMQTTCQAVRAIAMEAGFHEEVQQKLALRLKLAPPEDREERERMEREQRHHQAAARKLTPLVKYFGSESAVWMARSAIQIMGGSGYMKDYPAEKLLRDAIVFPIYEGTSQIQALMAMKDTLFQAIRHPQAFVRESASARWRSIGVGQADGLDRRVARMQSLSASAIQHLITRIAGDKLSGLRSVPVHGWGAALKDWDPKRDFGPAMLHAESLIRLLIDVSVSEIFQAQAERFPERAAILERWLDRAEPRARHLHDKITTTGDRLLAELAKSAPNPDPQAE